MARTILDIKVEAGYPYDFTLDMNNSSGEDLENDYNCYFECDSIGKLQFSVWSDIYQLEISKENTAKLLTNLEKYTVYTTKISDGRYDKMIEGRIHVSNKVRA